VAILELSIIETTIKYRKLAGKLNDLIEQSVLDDSVPEEIGPMLIRLYFAELFVADLQKCEDLLSEDTDEKTVESVAETAHIIDAILESVYMEIESYAEKDSSFAKTLEEVTEDSSTEGLHSLLYKLYRCGSIIREAYSSNVSIPLLGAMADSEIKPKSEFDNATIQEDSIQRRLGIDIYRLLEIKQELLNEIERFLGGPENIDKFINNTGDTMDYV
jgi:hypothetical protein